MCSLAVFNISAWLMSNPDATRLEIDSNRYRYTIHSQCLLTTNYNFLFATTALRALQTVFALAVMEYAVGVSKFGKNPMTL